MKVEIDNAQTLAAPAKEEAARAAENKALHDESTAQRAPYSAGQSKIRNDISVSKNRLPRPRQPRGGRATPNVSRGNQHPALRSEQLTRRVGRYSQNVSRSLLINTWRPVQGWGKIWRHPPPRLRLVLHLRW